MAHIITYKGLRQVKNLGWLLRHASECRQITLEQCPQGRGYMSAVGESMLHGTWYFRSSWASYKLAVEWCQRRSLSHVNVIQEKGV